MDGPTQASQAISETAKQGNDGLARDMQSQVVKNQNFEQAAEQIGSKLQSAPETVTRNDANYLKSREARATGQAQPGKESMSAEAQRVAAANEQGTTPRNDPLNSQGQSTMTRESNFEQAAQEVGDKMQNAPETVTAEDANYLKSREARVMGQAQPPKDSISADAQRLAAANEQGKAPSNDRTSPKAHSALAKEKNFQQAVAEVGERMKSAPHTVTQEDADLLHSREHRARGFTEKGGITSQAQILASQNKRA
ncbi:hypothetical protein LTR66_002244 [Elasticomyces elasticus]|nr:hypothetical protein LTR66_002244 [Elasticomyces elasticus]